MPDLATIAWQFNEAVSMLREAREHWVPADVKLAAEIDEGMPEIMAALTYAAEVTRPQVKTRCEGSGAKPAFVVARHVNGRDWGSGAPYDQSRPTGAGVCPECGKERSLRLDGLIAKHKRVVQ